MMTGFGLDLAGYTTNKTSLAAIEYQDKVANVTLLRHSSLSRERATAASVDLVLGEEAFDLKRCINLGAIAVDIPIDLQGLPYPEAPKQIWELTRRPIDNQLRAMPPFAERIGAPVVRFAAIMRRANAGPALGKSIFETYPAEIWKRLGIIAGAYKSRRKEKEKERRQACIALCRNLKIEPALENDDDIDAIICAVTAVAPEDFLCKPEDYSLERGLLPCGFRLLKRNPFDRICVSEEDFPKWMDGRENRK